MGALVDCQAKFLADFARLITWCVDNGLTVTAGELWRTQEQQDLYVKAGLSRTRNSRHLVRQAGDLNLIVKGRLGTKEEYQPAGEFWESLDAKNRWGGRFNDAPHFERMP